MMILRAAPASPFVRKVRIAADVLGLADRIEIVPADTTDAADVLRRQNPLGKIPTLVLENGETLYDSRVIVEYLDQLAGGGRILPASGWARIETLRLHALADGLMEAALLTVYEGRFRDESRREPQWLEHQAGKIARAMGALEALAPSLGDRVDLGTIALACALGYLDLRFSGTWRDSHPDLVAWLATFEERVPAFAATRFTG